MGKPYSPMHAHLAGCGHFLFAIIALIIAIAFIGRGIYELIKIFQ